jgi:hypothetical protein
MPGAPDPPRAGTEAAIARERGEYQLLSASVAALDVALKSIGDLARLRADHDDEWRDAELLEQLRRRNDSIKALNRAIDRQSRILAGISAKTESLLMHAGEAVARRRSTEAAMIGYGNWRVVKSMSAPARRASPSSVASRCLSRQELL